MKAIYTFILALFCVLCACSYSDEQLQGFDQRIQKFSKGKSFHLEKSESGLYTEILEVGTGREIHLTDSIGVTYIGTLLSGKKFDEQKKPFTCPCAE